MLIGLRNLSITSQEVIEIQVSETQHKYMVVEAEDHIFAMQLMRKEVICNELIWIRERPRLTVLDVTNRITPVYHLECNPDSENTDLITYINTKLLYVEQAFKRAIKEENTNLVFRRYQIKREILKNTLILATLSPNADPSLLKKNLRLYE